jgi:hypothetical protein
VAWRWLLQTHEHMRGLDGRCSTTIMQ